MTGSLGTAGVGAGALLPNVSTVNAVGDGADLQGLIQAAEYPSIAIGQGKTNFGYIYLAWDSATTETNDPEHKEHHGNYPQEREHEPEPGKEQGQEQQHQYQSHNIPLYCALALTPAPLLFDLQLRGGSQPLFGDGVLHLVGGVLDVFAGVLHPGLGLVRLTFVLEIVVAGDTASCFLHSSLDVLRII